MTQLNCFKQYVLDSALKQIITFDKVRKHHFGGYS